MYKSKGNFATVSIVLIFLFATDAYAIDESFTCPLESNAVCLNDGDLVCSSLAKCVSDDAVCFDSGTCGNKGFICKSKFDDLLDEYDDLVIKYNGLVQNMKRSSSEHSDFQSCVSDAASLDEAKNCFQAPADL